MLSSRNKPPSSISCDAERDSMKTITTADSAAMWRTGTGSADAIVHIRSRDIPSLEAALEKVRLAPNVDHTRSAIVLSRLINRGNG